MSLYVYLDGHYELHLAASHKGVRDYHDGKRTLVHVPVDWPELQAPQVRDLGPDELAVFALRPLQVGDQVGLYLPPKVRLTSIASVKTMPLHDMELGDLVALGRTEQDLEAYKQSWDECWEDDGLGWDTNPEVYAIRWEALK